MTKITVQTATKIGMSLKVKSEQQVFDELENQISITEGNVKYSNWMHSDLEKCFEDLKIHLALMTCEIVEKNLILVETTNPDAIPRPHIEKLDTHNTNILNAITCHELTIVGSNEGIVLAGSRLLPNYNNKDLKTDKHNWGNNEVYPYIVDLAEIVQRTIYEIECYVLDNKVGEKPEEEFSGLENETLPQGNMFETNEDGTPKVDLIPIKKSKGRPKKDKNTSFTVSFEKSAD